MGYTKKEIVNILKDIPLRDMKLPLTNGALVLEGGAFRGVYQEGVVDCLLDNGILFQTVIGVSAGGLFKNWLFEIVLLSFSSIFSFNVSTL